MKKYNETQILQIVCKSAKEYRTFLLNKHFMIVYQKAKQICCTHIGFRDYNFLHLTGLKTTLSAQDFFDACLNERLSIKNFSIDKNGRTQQKINVLPYLSKLLYNNCMIGDFINNGILIQADYFIGDTKAIISVGFRHGKNLDIPITLYNENIKKLSAPTCKVLAIFSKTYNLSKYTSCTYLSKGQNILNFPKDVLSCLDPSFLS